MTEKEVFVEGMKKRTKKFAVDVILFCNSLMINKASSVITYQLVKSATSLAAKTGQLVLRDLKKNFSIKYVLLSKKQMKLNFG